MPGRQEAGSDGTTLARGQSAKHTTGPPGPPTCLLVVGGPESDSFVTL
jgi:hypothetical protein